MDTIVEMASGIRELSVTLYCRPSFLATLARESGLGKGPVLSELLETTSYGLWYRQLPLTANLLYLAKSFLESPYRSRMRLLNAEGKALELLCETLNVLDTGSGGPMSCVSDPELRRLDSARDMLRTQLNPAPRVVDVARSIGMSESKLKRAFKARFGITVFDYGLECRMRHALELLRSKHMPVGQVAYAVGYRHPTSFTAAFRQFFGFLPKSARTEMH
ncbi:MAG: helix-turn-helix transcriptional regulator [Steroidobacteraceae bacterium]